MGTEAAEILDKAIAPVEQAPGVVAPSAQPLPDAKEDRVSSKLELLIRREQAAFERERFAKQREAELEEKLKRVSAFEETKTNPKKALEMLGLTYDQLTQSMLQDGEVPPQVEIQRLRDELGRYKKEQSDKEDQTLQNQKRLQAETEQKAISDFKEEINQYVVDNVSRYELTKFEQASELVFDVIDEHYKRTVDPQTGVGKVMSVKEACDKVEEHLEKKFADSRELNKVKALWGSIPPNIQRQIADKKQEILKTAPAGPKTLTNTFASAIQSKTPRMNEDQRISQIVQAFRAQKGI